jgi:hypothetical protein
VAQLEDLCLLELKEDLFLGELVLLYLEGQVDLYLGVQKELLVVWMKMYLYVRVETK